MMGRDGGTDAGDMGREKRGLGKGKNDRIVKRDEARKGRKKAEKRKEGWRESE